MSENMLTALMNFFIFSFILLLQTLTPKMTRKEIFFGVRIPSEEANSSELKNIYRGFVKDSLIFGVPSVLLFTYLTYRFFNPSVLILTPFGLIGILFFVYLKSNKKVKKLKEEKGWGKTKEQVVVVDTKFSREKSKVGTISSWWFLISVGIILLNIVVGFAVYPELPSRIPTHWDLQGNVNGYMNKSYLTAMLMPITQIIMLGIMFLSFKIIGWSKQEISAKNPEESLKANILFRKTWSIYIVVMVTVMNVFFTIINFYSFGVINISMKFITALLLIFTGLTLVSAILISLKVGQGGSRLKIRESKNGEASKDRDDDSYWKLGNTIYYNPDDPAIFIEKRFGVGWTVNAARPLGMIFLIIPIIIIVITMLISGKEG